MRRFCLFVGFFTVAMAASAGEVQLMTQKVIEERLTAPGSGTVVSVQKISTEARAPWSGEEVYTKHCVVCHATGIAGAPKKGDAAAWKPRLAQGMETLLQHMVSGFGAGMPPKGTCVTCSDDELKAALDYMSK